MSYVQVDVQFIDRPGAFVSNLGPFQADRAQDVRSNLDQILLWFNEPSTRGVTNQWGLVLYGNTPSATRLDPNMLLSAYPSIVNGTILSLQDPQIVLISWTQSGSPKTQWVTRGSTLGAWKTTNFGSNARNWKVNYNGSDLTNDNATIGSIVDSTLDRATFVLTAQTYGG